MPRAIPESLEALVGQLMKLPTVGRRSAERLAFHLLRAPKQQSDELAESIIEARARLRPCSRCHNLAEADLCVVCADPDRHEQLICVVEGFADALALESAGDFSGSYHVLGGVLSPLQGITPEDLHFDSLDLRVEEAEVKELIVAMNPSVDGEATALYIAQRYGPRGIKVSRIALGLPMGGSLEMADGETLHHALDGRTPMG
jgi:recombination protein RecR